MPSPRGGALSALVLLMALSRPGAGQVRPGAAQPTTTAHPVAMPSGAPARGALGSGLLSLALPGAGQYRLEQSRTWAYLALEVAAWTVHLEQRARGRQLRNRYHDLAWSAARIHDSPRREGTWDYYELLIHWTRSGAYDENPAAPGTQPESDPSTYNGWVWSLAREIYFPPGQSVSTGDPAYQKALAYYEAKAYGPAFLWDWRSSPGAQEEYAHLIDRSDAGFRRATIALGAVFANHLISAADAYLSGARRGPDRDAHLSLEPDVAPGGTRWTARLRIPWPR